MASTVARADAPERIEVEAAAIREELAALYNSPRPPSYFKRERFSRDRKRDGLTAMKREQFLMATVVGPPAPHPDAERWIAFARRVVRGAVAEMNGGGGAATIDHDDDLAARFAAVRKRLQGLIRAFEALDPPQRA